MTDFFTQPTQSYTPSLEPPGFDLLRDFLMRRVFQLGANPYGLSPQGMSGVGSQPLFSSGPNMSNPAFSYFAQQQPQTQPPQQQQPGQTSMPGPLMTAKTSHDGVGGFFKDMQAARGMSGFPGLAALMGPRNPAQAVDTGSNTRQSDAASSPSANAGGQRPIGYDGSATPGGTIEANNNPMPNGGYNPMVGSQYQQGGSMYGYGAPLPGGAGTPTWQRQQGKSAFYQNPQQYGNFQQMMNIMSGGINAARQRYGTPSGPPVSIPGVSFTGSQHEWGGNPFIANAAVQAGLSPQQFAQWMLQNQAARGTPSAAARIVNPGQVGVNASPAAQAWAAQYRNSHPAAHTPMMTTDSV